MGSAAGRTQLYGFLSHMTDAQCTMGSSGPVVSLVAHRRGSISTKAEVQTEGLSQVELPAHADEGRLEGDHLFEGIGHHDPLTNTKHLCHYSDYCFGSAVIMVTTPFFVFADTLRLLCP